jgi:hypothetical protein
MFAAGEDSLTGINWKTLMQETKQILLCRGMPARFLDVSDFRPVPDNQEVRRLQCTAALAFVFRLQYACRRCRCP